MKLPKHRRDEAALNSRLIRRPIKRMVWLFLLPTFGAFCIGFLYPFFKGLFLSFCNFRITSQWTWTGLENYRKAFQDPGYMHAFWYTALFALVSLIAINLFAFTIAYALTQKFKGTNVFRTVFFLPNLIGGIVLGYIWQILLNCILSLMGKPLLTLDSTSGYWGLIILMCWQQIGYMMIIYIAGLQSIPNDYIEAAYIDGATPWQAFWRVKLPNLMPSITICLFLTLTNSFKLFDQNLALTAGEPAHSTEMLAMNIYQTFYARSGPMWKGIGQAKAVLFCILVIAISSLQLKFTRSKEVQQ